MSGIDGIRLRRVGAGELPAVRPVLRDLYAGVYAASLREGSTTLDRFAYRLANHVTGQRWEAVIGYDGDTPIGYAEGAGRGNAAAWWASIRPPITDPELLREWPDRTFGLFEIMVCESWRKTGVARGIHDELLRGRSEERVTLTVDPARPRVRALYERWGYRYVGSSRPFHDSPNFDCMVRDLR